VVGGGHFRLRRGTRLGPLIAGRLLVIAVLGRVALVLAALVLTAMSLPTMSLATMSLATMVLAGMMLAGIVLAAALGVLAVLVPAALGVLDLLRRLALLRRLGDRVQDAEIMFGMLKIAFRHHPVARAGGIASELEILLEQLLRGAANPKIRSVAVEDMVAIERDLTVIVPDRRAATTTAATASRTMVATTHTFHVHRLVTALSWRCP
jgi:hypothetical protein